jgi:hypothetical protein
MNEDGQHRVTILERVLAIVAARGTEAPGLVDNSIIITRRELSLRIAVT